MDRAGDLLVVFARCPVPGRVKTRLATRIGDEPAAALYEAFVRDLATRFREAPFAVRWAIAPPDDGFAARFGVPASACVAQSGDDLGARMHAAFRDALGAGAGAGAGGCVLIGSDMPQLRVETVAEAFARLATADLVLGPADDGGYYLIGLRAAHDVFRGVPWSSAAVLDETLRRAEHLGLSVSLLERGFDVDEPADLERLRRLLEAPGTAPCPETARVLERVLAPSGRACKEATRMRCVLVSHTHWDREWYHTFQRFRARLVDAIDRVLDLVRDDPEFRFLLDGQTVVLEDYLEIRPERRAELEGACRERRITIGPWYVQPDSLLPSGETHVRNLLEGRRVGRDFGGVSRVAYTPDSFGHPAQLPQLLRGFDLEPFVYWRGNGSEIDDLPAEYLWEAPDGTAILVHHLAEGYFGAAGLPEDALSAALFLQKLGAKLGARTRSGRVLFMNGIDHAAPDATAGRAVEALRRATGWDVRRGVLEDFAEGLPREGPVHRGELVGGRLANLLPGVWSARLPQKLRNREAESRLLGWAEPWSALAARHGLPDERPALRAAWRSLLLNQAHDSICGCSQDRVHEQAEARWDAAIELAEETTARVLERLAGLDAMRRRPWDVDLDLAVFNPSPHPRTDVVRFALDPDVWVEFRGEIERSMQVHPLLGNSARRHGYTADGVPVRVVADPSPARMRLDPDEAPPVIELVARDVPAFGWKRVRLERSAPCPDLEDDGVEIAAGDVRVTARADGALDVRFGERLYAGLGALEDAGDRGDTYDFDPVGEAGAPRLESKRVRRFRHPSGLAVLRIERDVSTPASLDPTSRARSEARATSRLVLEARLAPGVARVDLDLAVENRARDHRLRLLFPTGAPVAELRAASTSDVVRRVPGAGDATGWVHPAPATFVQQGFVSAGGLTVAAPGLPEAEVTPDGTIAITLVRAVGWLARMDLASRPIPAGPVVPTPGAQCLGAFRARLSLLPELEPRAARDFEIGLLAVPAGEAPPLAPGRALVEIAPPSLLLEALKPADEGAGLVLRILNPTDRPLEATVRLGLEARAVTPVRLDEKPLAGAGEVVREGSTFRAAVPPHALRSFLVEA